ncbi:transcriptional regulator [Streptomyces sp. CB02923]|uniref:transcriptional regulator n=1 Tax=Streptomyces sp. CB02923 TaxID=1718985 RepID=UPI00093E497B|nr:transcriptional regulator [Streptomyces sp. CB02923]OKI01034.1 transcriptional regulator [Streptomyces sp. CB02923]
MTREKDAAAPERPAAPTAERLLESAVRELAPGAERNPLVARIAAGEAPREVFTALALEQHQVIASDRRSFRHLARRADGDPPVTAFFEALTEGESMALGALGGLADACGLDADAVRMYEPRAGCQAYPSYVARLALDAEPGDVVIALTANFAAWGGYCATVSHALRTRYAFPGAACAFFDFFAEPAAELTGLAHEAVRYALDTSRVTPRLAHRYGRLLQEYELMFWTALAE